MHKEGIDWEVHLNKKGWYRFSRLSSIMHAIINKDVLKLKRYSYADRLILDLVLSSFLKKLTLSCASTTGDDDTAKDIFTVQEVGGAIKFDKTHPAPGLCNLPHRVLARIQELACFSPDEALIDLDTGTVQGLDIRSFHVKSDMRAKAFTMSYPNASKFEVRMSSTQGMTGFHAEVKTLHELLRFESTLLNVFHGIVRLGLAEHTATTLALNLNVTSLKHWKTFVSTLESSCTRYVGCISQLLQ